MRLIIIPPYQNPIMNWGFVLRELVANMKRKGQLEGIEVDVDEGYLVESTSESRDEETRANISVGIVRKVREYSEMGKYDAIVLTGGQDPGFVPARVVSKIPVSSAVHSSFHIASLIGERFSVIHPHTTSALTVRHCAERYGLSHKLASVRCYGHSSTYIYGFLSKYKDNKEERIKIPEVKKIIGDITTHCIAAIEKDRVDSLILTCEAFETFEDEVRRGLDEAGYNEIPIISCVSAAVEVAKAMVNMKLVQTPRAYPRATLKATPEYW